MKVKPLIDNDNMTLLLSMVFKAGMYQLFQAKSWPHRFNNFDVYQFYKPETPYLGVNARQTAHLLMTEADVAKCRTSEINVCSPMTAMHNGSTSCSMSLFVSDPDATLKNCEAFFIRQPADRFVGFSHGISWVFSLDLTDAEGRPLPHGLGMEELQNGPMIDPPLQAQGENVIHPEGPGQGEVGAPPPPVQPLVVAPPLVANPPPEPPARGPHTRRVLT